MILFDSRIDKTLLRIYFRLFSLIDLNLTDNINSVLIYKNNSTFILFYIIINNIQYIIQQFCLFPPAAYTSISYNLINPSNNLFVTIASVTPNLADGEISAVPSLSIFECSPPTPLAYNPNDLATSFNFFSSVPPFVIFGNLPKIDYLFPVPILVGQVVITP